MRTQDPYITIASDRGKGRGGQDRSLLFFFCPCHLWREEEGEGKEGRGARPSWAFSSSPSVCSQKKKRRGKRGRSDHRTPILHLLLSDSEKKEGTTKKGDRAVRWWALVRWPSGRKKKRITSWRRNSAVLLLWWHSREKRRKKGSPGRRGPGFFTYV